MTRFRNIAVQTGVAGAALALMVLAATPWLALRWPIFEIGAALQHFGLYGSVGLAVLLLLTRQRIAALTTCLLASAFAFHIHGYRGAPLDDEATGAEVRLVFANVFNIHSDKAKLERHIRDEDPDIVALVEAGQDWGSLMASLEDLYPYGYHTGSDSELDQTDWSARRLMVLSKTAFREHPTLAQMRYGNFMRVELSPARHASFDLTVVHFHRPWPFSTALAQTYNVNQLTRFLLDDPSRSLVVGDFNATGVSTVMRRLERLTPLRLVQVAEGTWPAFAPPFARIGIDQALAGTDIAVKARRTGPDYGSDHLPVTLDLVIREQDSERERLATSAP